MDHPGAYTKLLEELLRRLWEAPLAVAMFFARAWFMILGMVVGVKGAENDWDDITDNLFTDLAPLLALFGERVTTQFISQAIGWEDCIMLAMAPLGVLTIVISAIRVGGPMWLKAIIGRARENIAAAEMEVMSSTSKDVCELNNGAGIVRCQGTSPVLEFICVMPEEGSIDVGEQCKFVSITLDEALQQGKLVKSESWNPFSACKHWLLSQICLVKPGQASKKESAIGISTSHSSQDSSPWPRSRFHRKRGSDIEMTLSPEELDVPPSGSIKSASSTPTITIIHDTRPEAPNLSLNLQNSSDRSEIRYFAFLGIILQLAVLAFLVAMTYHPTFKLEFVRDESLAPEYAFAMTMGGTIALVIGLLICSYVIEISTDEELYSLPDGGPRIKLYWLQQEQTVNDQGFSSIATYPKGCQSIVTMSRRRKRTKPGFGLETRTLLGTTIAMIGFVVQFIGFRGMHSAASTSQLVAVGIMTVIRAWLRRNLAKRIHQTRLVPNHELDWLAMELQQLSEDVSDPGHSTAPHTDNSQQDQQKSFGSWEVDPSWDCTYQEVQDRMKERSEPRNCNVGGSFDSYASSAQRVFELRRNLGSLVQIRGHSVADAVNLADAINSSQDTISAQETDQDSNSHTWLLPVIYTPPGSSIPRPEKVKIVARSRESDQRVTAEQMDAVISLWTYAAASSSTNFISSEDENNPDFSDRRRRYENYLRGSLAPQGFMVVGKFTQQTVWPLVHNLLWWAPEGTDELLRIEKMHLSNSSSSISSHPEWQEQSAKPLQRRSNTIEASRLVGGGNQAALHGATHSNIQRAKQESSHQIAAFKLDDDLTHFRRSRGQMSTDKDSRNKDVTLALSCEDDLEKLYSKALLLNFLNSAAKQLTQPISVEIEVRQADTEHHGFPHLGHEVLKSLVGIIVDAKYGFEQSAYVMLIAALWPTGILPLPASIFNEPTKLQEQIAAAVVRENHCLTAMEMVAETWANFFYCVLSHMHGSRFFLAKGLALMVEISLLFENQESVNDAIDVAPSTQVAREWQSRRHSFVPSLLSHAWNESEEARNALRAIAAEWQSQGRNLPGFLPKHLIRNDDKHEGMSSVKVYPLNEPKGCDPQIHENDPASGNDIDIDLDDYRLEGQSICNWTNWHLLVISEWDTGGPMPPSYRESDISAQDLRGYTPLHYAAERGHVNRVSHLLNSGASAAIAGIDGMTPLHIAARAGRAEIVEVLMSNLMGFSSDTSPLCVEDNQFWTPLNWATYSGSVETTLAIARRLNKGLSEVPQVRLHAISMDHVGLQDEIVRNLIERKDKFDWTATITLACEYARWELTEKLLDPSIRQLVDVDCDPFSLLQAIEQQRHAPPPHVLLELLPRTSFFKGVRPHQAFQISKAMCLAAGARNSTPLETCLQWLGRLQAAPSSSEVVFRTYPNFAPTTASDIMNHHAQPLHAAIRAVVPKNVELLLRFAADTGFTLHGDKTSFEVIQTAREAVNEADLLDTVKLLIEYGASIDNVDLSALGWFYRYPTVYEHLIAVSKR